MTQPKRKDEITLYNTLRGQTYTPNARQPGRQVIEEYARLLSMPEKRVTYLLDKWTSKGWWDWGVNQYGGWFTNEAPERLS